MLNIYTGNNTFIMTLTEKQTISAPNYVFVFTHRTTNDEYTFLKLNADDTSLYKERYNKFTINSNLLGKPGQYEYKVYQTNTNTTDITNKVLLESGIAIFHENDLTYITRNKNNEFIIQ